MPAFPRAARWPETWILLALLAGRGLMAADAGLGRDESAYWYWAWHGLDASYSLATGFAVRLATMIGGDAPFAARVPSLLAGVAAVGLLIRATRRLGAAPRDAVAAGLVLASVPTVSFSGSFIHPDAFLVPAVVWFAERLGALAKDGPRPGILAALAAAAALAALTKHTGVLLAAPAALVLWRHRRERGAVPAAAILLAAGALLLLAADPRILSGLRDFGRFAPGVPGASRVLAYGVENVLWSGPALLAAAGLGIAVLRGAAARREWPLVVTFGLWTAFFLAFAGLGQAKANWLVPAFVVLVPPAVKRWAERGRPAWGAALVALSVLITAAQGTAVLLPGQPALWERFQQLGWVQRLGPSYGIHAGERERAVSPTRTWTERAEEFREAAGTDPRLTGAAWIASNDYGLAFRIAHHAGRHVKVLLPGDPVFARTCGGNAPPAAEVLFVSRTESPPADRAGPFSDVRELPAGAGCFKDLKVWSCRMRQEGTR